MTDVVFDPVRPYLYASSKAAKKVYFVKLLTGLTEREYSFGYMPESVAIAPDGSRLYVALLTREHTCCWDSSTQEGYVASFDLATQVKDREFRITLDPFDVAVTSDGHLVVPSGSDQWTLVKVFDAATGQQTGVVGYERQRMRLALHPSEGRVYAADTDSSVSSLVAYRLIPGGGITRAWGSSGGPRMEDNVWASPTGDYLVTRRGDVLTSTSIQSTDMRYISALSAGTITQLAWDAPGRVVFTLEGSTVHYYNLITHLEIGSQAVSGPGTFIGVRDGEVYVTVPTPTTTQLVFFHIGPGGAVNTAPVPRFIMTPATGGTTDTDFVFDASSSTDAEDALSSLRFRWDFDNNGTWDTPFQTVPIATHRYSTTGPKAVRVQVRDPLALAGDLVQSFDVALAPDPGAPGPAHPPFSLPFQITRAVFDPIRPYLYASDKASKKLYFVNLLTGLTESGVCIHRHARSDLDSAGRLAALRGVADAGTQPGLERRHPRATWTASTW
jgi:DNA-binding beta-propeller fold protein YncE